MTSSNSTITKFETLLQAIHIVETSAAIFGEQQAASQGNHENIINVLENAQRRSSVEEMEGRSSADIVCIDLTNDSDDETANKTTGRETISEETKLELAVGSIVDDGCCWEDSCMSPERDPIITKMASWEETEAAVQMLESIVYNGNFEADMNVEATSSKKLPSSVENEDNVPLGNTELAAGSFGEKRLERPIKKFRKKLSKRRKNVFVRHPSLGSYHKRRKCTWIRRSKFGRGKKSYVVKKTSRRDFQRYGKLAARRDSPSAHDDECEGKAKMSLYKNVPGIRNQRIFKFRPPHIERKKNSIVDLQYVIKDDLKIDLSFLTSDFVTDALKLKPSETFEESKCTGVDQILDYPIADNREEDLNNPNKAINEEDTCNTNPDVPEPEIPDSNKITLIYSAIECDDNVDKKAKTKYRKRKCNVLNWQGGNVHIKVDSKLSEGAKSIGAAKLAKSDGDATKMQPLSPAKSPKKCHQTNRTISEDMDLSYDGSKLWNELDGPLNKQPDFSAYIE